MILAKNTSRLVTLGLEDSPDGRRCDTMAEAGELAVDVAISPRGVIGGHLDHKSGSKVAFDVVSDRVRGKVVRQNPIGKVLSKAWAILRR